MNPSLNVQSFFNEENTLTSCFHMNDNNESLKNLKEILKIDENMSKLVKIFKWWFIVKATAEFLMFDTFNSFYYALIVLNISTNAYKVIF